MSMQADFTVIGAGVVGASIAYGLQQRGHSVIVLDGGRADPRASGANFGLVWVQGKGSGVPGYQRLTRDSADRWADFAAALAGAAGEKTALLAHERNGGLTFTFGEAGYRSRQALLHRLHNEGGPDGDDTTMLDRAEVQRLLPDLELGPDVSGASFCWRDGCVDSLKLHDLLLRAIGRAGGRILRNATVTGIRPAGSGGWTVMSGQGAVSTGHVVVAAGLGSRALAPLVGLDMPVWPQRGQIVVSQRLPRLLALPTHTLRQTADGTLLVGGTKEDVGFDPSTTLSAARDIARSALRIAPALRHMTVVRHWAGLRVMTPDGAPVYDFAANASGAVCHSGVTLAPVHAGLFVEAILAGSGNRPLAPFGPARFRPAA